MTTRRRALMFGLTAGIAAVLSAPGIAHAGDIDIVAEGSSGGVSAWWWMLLLLLPVAVLILATVRGRGEYDFTTYTPATGPGFPAVSSERSARLAALASGRASSAAEAIAHAEALAEAAARPVRPGARVPSEGGAVPLPIGASRPLLEDGMRAPDGYEIKAVVESGRYHRPTDADYAAVKPDLWFATAPTAESAGFTAVG
ncbi:sunset domain-containing protein [Gordonia hydrophobica]|uniref:Uncharacterized protein n=1 Tax=Gordonia hydrophobica TaxID=40516 RepID=A0ABZ2U5L2_9ACTN|nr:hypothetical protein [Gordonia hydrophobica]MBM7367460.1 hypothetical protein [Gordonia hydrophobica]